MSQFLMIQWSSVLPPHISSTCLFNIADMKDGRILVLHLTTSILTPTYPCFDVLWYLKLSTFRDNFFLMKLNLNWCTWYFNILEKHFSLRWLTISSSYFVNHFYLQCWLVFVLFWKVQNIVQVSFSFDLCQ